MADDLLDLSLVESARPWTKERMRCQTAEAKSYIVLRGFSLGDNVVPQSSLETLRMIRAVIRFRASSLDLGA